MTIAGSWVTPLLEFGVRLWLEGDRLRSEPDGALLPEALSRILLERRDGLVAELKAKAGDELGRRLEQLRRARFNVGFLAAAEVPFDHYSESWSDHDAAWIDRRLQALTESLTRPADLDAAVQRLFRLPRYALMSTGLSAMAAVCAALRTFRPLSERNLVLHTGLSPRWQFQLLDRDYQLESLLGQAPDPRFAGDPDPARLERLSPEQRASTNFVVVEPLGADHGAAAVSLAGLRSLRAQLPDAPLVLDATHLLDNARRLSAADGGQHGRDPLELAAELCELADIVVASFSRGYALPFGGLVAARDQAFMRRVALASAASGRLSAVQHKLIAHALAEPSWLLGELETRAEILASLSEDLRQAGLSGGQRAADRALMLDSRQIGAYSGESHQASLLADLFLTTGIRALPLQEGATNGGASEIALVVPLGLERERAAEVGRRLALWVRGATGTVLRKDGLDLDDRGLPHPCFRLDQDSAELLEKLRAATTLATPLDWLPGPAPRPLGEPATSQALENAPAEPVLPLSEGQKALYFIHHLAPDNNMCGAFRIPADADVDLIMAAFADLQQRHPMLRTTFFHDGERPMQRVHATLPVALQRHRVAAEPQALIDKVRELTHTAMDLERGPLARIHLIEGSSEGRFLLVLLHHLINDGASQPPMLEDWTYFCHRRLGLEQPALPELLADGYGAFVAWQHQLLRSAEGQALLDFWRARLEPPPPALPLATDLPRPARMGYRGALCEVVLEPEFVEAMRKACNDQHVSLFMFMLAAWQILIGRASRTHDVCVGSLNGSRPAGIGRGEVGFFTNVLALRANLAGNPSLSRFFDQVRDLVFDAIEHADYPFNHLAETLGNPHIYQAGIVYQSWMGAQEGPADNPFGLHLKKIHQASFLAASQTDLGELTLELAELEAGLILLLKYNVEVFTEPRIAALGRRLKVLMRQMIEHPERGIDDLELLDPAERALVLEHFNATAQTYRLQPSFQVLSAWACRQPAAAALFDHRDPVVLWDYAQFEARVAGLAAHLQALGVGPDQLVGVCMSRSPALVVALFAVQAAGGAYVPLDPSHPPERLAYMVEDAAVSLVLAQHGGPSAFGQATVLQVDGDLIERQVGRQPSAWTYQPERAAYMIYTSGSTGRPKGAINSHGAILNRLAWHQDAFALQPGERVMQKTPFSFDVSVWEFFWPFHCGGALVVAAADVHKDPAALLALTIASHTNVMHFVPSMFQAFLEEPGLERLTSLRAVICSGEALSRNLQRLCFDRLPGVALHNLYGPTEAAVDVSWWPCQPGDEAGFVPIGAPIANTSLYVVDPRLRALGIDLPGELCLGGVQLARGYHRRPALTAEKFVPDPFAKTPGARLYRTGDLASWLASGNVRFLGRLDFQIKLRGLRIELGELEAAINAVPGVSETVVMARKDHRGELGLVAYAQSPLPAEALARVIRESLSRQLPAYMVPAAVVVLERFPTSPNGKVERRLLPEPSWHRDDRRRTPPRTELELKLARIWADVLALHDAADRPALDLEDSFLDLGGHSLSATRLVARIRRELGCELSLQEFFGHPTLGDQVELLAQRVTGGQVAQPSSAPWPRLPRAGSGSLSAAQRRLLFIEQLEPGLVAYLLAGAARLSGHLDVARLQAAFALISQRHESLRSAFRQADDGYEQFFNASVAPPLERIDHSHLAPAARQAALEDLARARAAVPFELGQPPLWRVALVRSSDHEHVLLLEIHHLIADFWSITVLLAELGECYAALGEDRPPRLAELQSQYVDYAWQQAPPQRQRVSAQLGYWRRQLDGVPALLDLPLDFPRPARPSYRGALHPLELNQASQQAVQALCRRLDITPYVALLAVFQRLLRLLSGERDIVVGMPLANREQAEIQDLIGFFVNTLVQRTHFSAAVEQADFESLALQVGQRVREAMLHQDVPFEELVDALDLPRDQSHNPLYQVVFQLLDLPAARHWGDMGWQLLALDYGIARFDLALHLYVDGERVHGCFEYSSDLFRPSTVARFAELFLHQLEQLLAEPRRPLVELAILPERQRRALLHVMGDPCPPTEELYQTFLRHALMRPDAKALICGETTLTYVNLALRANRLAQTLQARGVRPGDFVALACDRSPLAVIALLAIIELGAAYLPIDTSYPAERVEAMLADSDARLLLCVEASAAAGPAERVLRLDLLDLEADMPMHAFPVCEPQAAAYLMYTSGSTGKPKGVVVPRRAIVRLVRATGYCDFGPDRVFMLAASLAFDAATFEIWGALLNGASLAILPGRTIEPLPGLLRQHRVDTLWLTAQLFHMVMDEDPDSLAGCRQLLAGGEALSPRHVRAFLERFPENRLINGYGPTENTTFTCCADLGQTGLLPGGAPLGGPIAGTTVLIVDAALRLVPIGIFGELVTGGVGLAWGYHRRPALTAEKFVPNPFADQPGERLYRTGDLTRWQVQEARALVEFAGRIDRQVKLRGFRIELGEIEASLLSLPGVAQALVVPLDRSSLAAYLVANEVVLEVTALRAALSQRLPDYMVPAHFLVLPAFPINANGKIDRRLLPLPQVEAAQSARPPADALEEILVNIWVELLGLDQVNVDSDFFAAGGNSLLAVRTIARVRRHLGVEVPLRVLFERPTVAGLADWLRARSRSQDPRPALVATAEHQAPLSYTQTRLWFVDQLEPGSSAYNIPLALRLMGPLCSLTLTEVLARLVARHESLRTRFIVVGEEPRQQVDPPSRPRVAMVDLSQVPPASRGPLAARILAREAARPFDLARGPLLRCVLVRQAPDLHLFLLNLHHIIGDGRTLEVLLDELREGYGAISADREPSLPALALQYRDFARWQRAWPREWLDQRLRFWVEQLAGAPPLLTLPADFSRPARAAPAGSGYRFPLPSHLLPMLDRHCQRTGATRYMALLGIYGALLSRYAGQPEVCVGSPVAQRAFESLERVVGYFANTLVMRLDLSADPDLDQLIARTRHVVLEALEHQDMPFELLVERLAPKRLPGVTPLFQTSFALETIAPEMVGEGLSMGPLRALLEETQLQSAKFDCSLLLFQDGAHLHARLEYSVELFRPATITALAQTYAYLLEQWLDRPQTPLAKLAWLDPSTRAMVLNDWNPSPHQYPRDASIQSLVAAWVARQPDAVALLFEDQTRSYRQWWDEAAALAQELRRRGVQPGDFVAVCLPRSFELMAAVLAVLQVGAVYQPIDPSLPRERQVFMLEETAARLIVSSRELSGLELGLERVLVEDPRQLAGGFSFFPGWGEQLAYIMYTSGSTGRPKGVAATHRGAIRLVRETGYMSFNGGERSLLVGSIGFDATVFDMWSSLLNGGSLAILPEGAFDRLGTYLREYQVTTTFLTTQLFHVLVDEQLGSFSQLRQVVTGGEVLSPGHARRFLEAHPQVRLYNAYGPTENGAFTTSADLTRVPILPSGAPLGRAIDHTVVYVVDRDLRAQALGAFGELVTGGDGLAQGYYRRPALTAEKFVPDPFSGRPGARLYRTGDLVRWVQIAEGSVLEFAGRIDRQVKLRGFRIELGEIEGALARLPGVAQTLVVLDSQQGEARVVAYAVPKPGMHLESAVLLRELSERLPGYMVPAAVVPLEQFPLNANGKIDRTRLPQPMLASTAHQVALTPGQSWLAELWRELLGAQVIGPGDNFFELGGHSLLATRLVARVRARLGLVLSLQDVFAHGELAAMAEIIERASSIDEAPQLLAENLCELSFSQQRLWFIDQLQPGDPTFHIPLLLRWRGGLDVPRLARALQLLVERHEALRTSFPALADGPRQRIEEPLAPPACLIDLSRLAEAERTEATVELARRVARAPFQLTRAPLFRWLLIRLSHTDHRLVLTLHHIIADGWSLAILLREWVQAYDALALAQTPAWPPLALRYRDYAVRQRAEFERAGQAQAERFWRETLAGQLPPLEMPTDNPRPKLQDSAGALVVLPFPSALSQALTAFRRAQGATTYQVLLAVLAVLLRRYSGQDEFLVATPVANRDRAELESLIGFFVNTLVLRLPVGAGDQFTALVARAVAASQAAFAHADFPFERLVAMLQPERDLGRAPLAQVMFQVLEHDSFEAATPSRLEVLDPPENPAQLDLSFAVRGQEGSQRLYLTYATALFRAEIAQRLGAHFLALATALLAAPDAAVDRVAFLGQDERAHLLTGLNRTASDFDHHATLHGLILAQAARQPKAIAVICGQTRLDFASLLGRARANAARLRVSGVLPEQPVGVCLHRDEDLIVALLAVLLAGGAYVPIDPAYPEDRKRHMLEDSGARVILTDQRERENLPAALERLTVSHEHLENLGEPCCPPEQLAYIIYTSGSTGRPKGVAIQHLNANALIHWSQRYFSDEEMAVVLASTSICFDLSVFEIFATLARGCRLVVVENVLYLGDAPAAGEVTMINTVPSAMAELLHLGVPTSVTTVNLAGEPFQASLIHGIYALPHVKAVHNLYGPSEDTTYSTGTLLPRDLAGIASIGGPILNTQLYLLDRYGAPVPFGVAGEVQLGGLGITRGYFRRPALTAEKFVPDPFGATPGGRLYRTGDLARYRCDGAPLFLGRIDHQVKIRGFRIELGEIEARIALLPEVEKTLVTTHQDDRGIKRLVAYVQPHKAQQAPDEARLRTHLEAQLPEYMVPAAFILLEFPLTPNGKIDRKRLPAPVFSAVAEGAPEPLSPIASQLAAIWSDVIGQPVTRGSDHFFQLGGHSLLATRVVTRVRQQLGLELELRALFEHPTLADLAARVEKLVGTAAAPPRPVAVSAFREDEPQLAFAQSRLWFIDQLEPGNPAYNLPVCLELDGPLIAQAMDGAFLRLAQRHESLRTRFAQGQEGPYQLVAPRADVIFQIVDLRALGERARPAVESLLGAEAMRPFDLTQGPLWRVCLFQLDPRRHFLIITLHHTIGDGWSLSVLLRELLDHYRALATGQPDLYPALAMQYRDYVRWQYQLLAEGEIERQLAFWRDHHAGELPVLELPTDRTRPPTQDFHGDQVQLTLSSRARARLLAFARERSRTPYQTLLTVLVALLHRYSGQEEVIVGTPVANRDRVELEPMIGFFVNTLVPRLQVSGGLSFEQLLAQTSETTLACFSHRDLPFERLVEALQPERDLSRNPLFQIMFQYMQIEDLTQRAAGLRFTPYEQPVHSCHFDLSFSATERGHQLTLYLAYATALFEQATATRFLAHFAAFAEALVTASQRPIAEVAFLGAEERALLLETFNRTDSPYQRTGTIGQAFLASCVRTPDRLALCCGEVRWTYAQLAARAAGYARALRQYGVSHEQTVGVCMMRRADLIAALLGTLLAGAAYVPLDPAYPEERKAYMLEDSGARLCIVDDETAVSLPSRIELVFPEDALAASEPADACELDASSLAYLIYTSGSTGRPKGVAISHSNALALFHWASQYFPVTAWDGVLASTSVCFDLSVFEIFATLANGGKLILVENLLYLADSPLAPEVRMLNTVPSAMTELLRMGAVPPSVTEINLAGEPFQASLIRDLYALPHVRVVNNLYGPSEDTTYSTGCALSRDLEGIAPIGGPILNTQLYLVDRAGLLCARGLAGEILLGGDGLSRGYYRRPAMTAARYVPNPFAGSGQRLYRTGDLGRWRNDGSLVYLGRIDHQVKLRGFRIELGEIEVQIAKVPGVVKCLVMAPTDRQGSRRLVAFVQSECGPRELEQELRAHLGENLPEYMVPAVIAVLAELPLTPNGKVDRKRLLELPLLQTENSQTVSSGTAPNDALEAKLLAIWCEVLGLERVGVHDNFFKLGGHSLLAVRVLAKITQQFGVRLPLASFFQATTIVQLAQLLRREHGAEYRPLHCLRAKGARAPLYLVHAIGGGLLGYRALVDALSDRPVYGFVAPGFEDDGPAVDNFTELARQYVDALLDHQPQGPHLLAGWSLGGVLATAMVARLAELGQPTLPPLLFDAHAPSRHHKQAYGGGDSQTMAYFLLDLAGQFGLTFNADSELLEAERREGAISAGFRWAQARGLLGSDLDAAEFKRLFQVFRAHLHGLLNYEPHPQSGTVYLFRAEQGDAEQGGFLGWDQLFAQVETQVVPGDHFSLLTAPQLSAWVAALEGVLEALVTRRGPLASLEKTL